jgi:hypothetical protein
VVNESDELAILEPIHELARRSLALVTFVGCQFRDNGALPTHPAYYQRADTTHYYFTFARITDYYDKYSDCDDEADQPHDFDRRRPNVRSLFDHFYSKRNATNAAFAIETSITRLLLRNVRFGDRWWLHDALLEFCMTVAPLDLPAYVQLHILDSFEVLYAVPHRYKINVIIGVRKSIAKLKLDKRPSPQLVCQV